MERVPMTPEGYEKMRRDLQHLKGVVRPQNIRDIEEARAHGDLSENAEYSAAKEKQSVIAAQINDLESKISLAEVIDPKELQGTEKIVFGATTLLYDQETEEEITYQIVGDDESDVKLHRIGISSPIARGLIGKKPGDEVKIKTPKGVREFEVIEVSYK